MGLSLESGLTRRDPRAMGSGPAAVQASKYESVFPRDKCSLDFTIYASNDATRERALVKFRTRVPSGGVLF